MVLTLVRLHQVYPHGANLFSYTSCVRRIPLHLAQLKSLGGGVVAKHLHILSFHLLLSDGLWQTIEIKQFIFFSFFSFFFFEIKKYRQDFRGGGFFYSH